MFLHDLVHQGHQPLSVDVSFVGAFFLPSHSHTVLCQGDRTLGRGRFKDQDVRHHFNSTASMWFKERLTTS